VIVRAPRATANYTVLPNRVLRDNRLSWKARGLLAYLLSMPDNWRTNSSHLASVGPDGREAVRTGLAELEAAGYLARRRSQDDAGHWSTVTYVYDTPQDAVSNPVENGAVVHTPASGFPTPVNPTLIEELKKKNVDQRLRSVSSKGTATLCTRCAGSGRTVTGLGNVLPCSTCHGGGIV
jgi:hypothetical protein